METEKTYDFKELKHRISTDAARHHKWGGWDATIYNGTTIAVIVLTSLAALLPEQYTTLLKIFSGAAGILVAIDRALLWGSRWIYHRQMRQEYLIILEKISFYENMPISYTPEEQRNNYMEIYTELYNIRRKEATMPGVKVG